MNLFFLVGLAVFTLMRHHEVISQRVPSLVYIIAACSILFSNFHVLLVGEFQFLYAQLPCFLEVWLLLFIIPVWQSCYLLRALYAVANYRLNQAILQLQTASLMES
jgi:hypothetical protein